jgi:hypothetical protein
LTTRNGLSSFAYRGAATGALFMAGFGSIWFFLALVALTQRFYWWYLLPAIAPALLVWVSIRRLRTPRPPLSTEQLLVAKKIRRQFGIVNAIQWTAVGILVAILSGRGRQDLIVPAIVVVVALHFIPLAVIFRAPTHHVTCALLLGWVVACYGLRFASADVRSAAIAIGTGTILWTAGAIGLLGIARR